MKAVVPAAGLASRMQPATKAVPKTLLPVLDRPVLQHVVEEALAAGAGEVVVVVGPDDEAVRDHLARDEALEAALADRGKDGARRAVREAAHPERVRLVTQPEPRGLGDAVLRARDAVGDEAFLVLCADDVVPGTPTASDLLARVHRERGGSVFAVRELPREVLARYGAVDAEPVPEAEGLHRVRDVVEKPDPAEAPSRLSTMGRYLFTPSIFPHLEATQPVDGELELSDAMARMAREDEATLLAREYDGPRFDVGTPLGFLEANVGMAARREGLREEALDLLEAILARERGG